MEENPLYITPESTEIDGTEMITPYKIKPIPKCAKRQYNKRQKRAKFSEILRSTPVKNKIQETKKLRNSKKGSGKSKTKIDGQNKLKISHK